MNQSILNIIHQEYTGKQRMMVIHELSSIELHHTMDAEDNLGNTRLSILKLAKGNINKIIDLTATAKIDFRDVILWASQE